jgi:hypothetical protein
MDITHRSLALASFSAAVILTGCGGGTTTATTPAPILPAPSACTTPTATITHTATTVPAQQLVVLDTTKYPQAKCNDGTAAAYVLRAGAGAASTRWIISLQGGGECYHQASCSNRAATMPNLVSTAGYQANPSSAFGQAGIQSPTILFDPDFYDASQVTIQYCSSDDWSGAKASTVAYSPTDPTTWNFQGHAIVAAVIADLNASHGLASATEVMLTGQSAGGVGVFANVNTVAKLFPSSVRFTAYSDAGFGNGTYNFLATGTAPNYDDTVSTPNQVAKRIPALTLWNGTGDAACAAAATSTTAQINCYSGQTLLASGGTINLPMLVSVAEKDTNQLNTAGIPQADLTSQTFSTAETGYIAYFAASMRSNLATTNTLVSIFSPDIFAHIEANDPTLFTTSQTFPSGSLSLQQAVATWYRNPCSAQRNIAN